VAHSVKTDDFGISQITFGDTKIENVPAHALQYELIKNKLIILPKDKINDSLKMISSSRGWKLREMIKISGYSFSGYYACIRNGNYKNVGPMLRTFCDTLGISYLSFCRIVNSGVDNFKIWDELKAKERESYPHIIKALLPFVSSETDKEIFSRLDDKIYNIFDTAIMSQNSYYKSYFLKLLMLRMESHR
jgi:hypothetical protein